MCGIFGFDKITDFTAELAGFLALAMETRGSDSWGKAETTKDGKLRILKQVGPISSTFEYPEPGSGFTMYHTRAATKGSISRENTHPFIIRCNSTNSSIVGIHNGFVANHNELNNKYARGFSVDSQHIFAHLVERRDIRELNASGAIVWMMIGENGIENHLLKMPGGALEVLVLSTGEIVFCSLSSPIVQTVNLLGGSIQQYLHPDPNTKYLIRDGKIIKQDTLMIGSRYVVHHGFRWPQASRNLWDFVDYSSNSKSQVDDCFKCSGAIDPKKQVICNNCFAQFKKDYAAKQAISAASAYG